MIEQLENKKNEDTSMKGDKLLHQNEVNMSRLGQSQNNKNHLQR